MEHAKIKYVVIQIPKFHLFIKIWFIVRCDFPKRDPQKGVQGIVEWNLSCSGFSAIEGLEYWYVGLA